MKMEENKAIELLENILPQYDVLIIDVEDHKPIEDIFLDFVCKHDKDFQHPFYLFELDGNMIHVNLKED